MSAPNFLVAWNKCYNVTYDINPWMTDNLNLVDNQKAYEQWLTLVKILKSLGATVSQIIVDNPDIPDIVFTANAGVIFNNKVILSQFKHYQRQKEIPYFNNWFKTHLPINICSILEYFEGAGDALIDNKNNIWVGHGFRSTFNARFALQNILPSLNLISLKLINPEFYHLDTCFCPLNSGHVLYYPEAICSADEIKIYEQYDGKMIKVSMSDAVNFACNIVEWKNNLILNKCSAKLNYELEKIGYNVIETDLSEFIKAGGSAKCLTLKLTDF